jgi:hypothetical protein
MDIWARSDRRAALGDQSAIRQRLVQAEVYVDDHLYGHGMALISGGPESVLLDGGDGFFVKAHAEMTDYTDILRETLRIDDELHCDNSLKICASRIGCELRLDGMNHLRSADAASDAHDTAAVAAATARSLTGAVA